MNRLIRLVVYAIFGLSALVVIEQANSVERAGIIEQARATNVQAEGDSASAD